MSRPLSHCTPRPSHSNLSHSHSLPSLRWVTRDDGPALGEKSHTRPNSSFPSAALREVAMPSLSGQPIDFGGGHVGWLPVEEHARRGRPRSEVDGAASKQPLQAWKKARPMVEGALIQPVTTSYRLLKVSFFLSEIHLQFRISEWGGELLG